MKSLLAVLFFIIMVQPCLAQDYQLGLDISPPDFSTFQSDDAQYILDESHDQSSDVFSSIVNEEPNYAGVAEYRQEEITRRRSVTEHLLHVLPDMCLVVPNFDGGLLAGCLYHFKVTPHYVSFDEAGN